MSFNNKNEFISVPKPLATPSKMRGLPVIDLINKYYDESINAFTTDNADFLTDRVKTLKKFNKKHDVCGKGNYVKKALNRQDEDENPCNKCPALGLIESKEYEIKKEGVLKGYPEIPSYDQLQQMCETDIYKWFPAQHDAKPYGKETGDKAGMAAWTRIKTAINNDDGKTVGQADKNLLTDWYIDRLDDDYLRTRMVKLNWREDIKNKEKRLKTFKEEISKGRGASVKCKPNPPPWLDINNVKGDELKQLTEIKEKGCSLGDTFGPKYIISKEYEEWSADYMADPKNLYESGRGDFKLWGKPLMPINREFEKCINNVLNENSNKYGKKMIQGIHDKNSIYQLDDDEILFIKRKLQMLFVDDPRDDVLTCIKKNMMLDNTICEAGLTEQMNFVLNVLFSIIGFKFNLYELDINNSENKEQLIYIIDQLGDIIPKALKKIVDISKKIEIEQCGGIPSNNTLVLEELYKKIFTSGKTVVNFDLGISDMISKASNQEFDRTTVMVVLAIAFLKYF